MESVDLLSEFAYCGIHCATCGPARWGDCTGCKSGGGFARCPVRICALSRSYATCAQCTEMESCKKLDTLLSRICDLVFCSHRMDNLREIRRVGSERFAAQFHEAKQPSG